MKAYDGEYLHPGNRELIRLMPDARTHVHERADMPDQNRRVFYHRLTEVFYYDGLVLVGREVIAQSNVKVCHAVR